ncbi:hypothetical protein HMPREF1544_10975 [Mucor circinelloides 1006PhL]|uniref:EF-hand domain-containing protein n=1 Tax=Mucor circinelloides f. circinelloides (strain 1006PhL) TaxID=1220926 RepID=S2JR81_MUCC1|nr:hypothetical protein HMPREF1544_10975 [Mucor circinelloides 1006PhL]
MESNKPSRTSSITEEEMNSLKEAFALYDTNHNGAIDLQQFAKILKSLNIETNDDKLDVILKKVDKNHDGEIDFDEFVSAMTHLLTQESEISSEPESLRRWKTYPEPEAQESNQKKKDKSHYSRRMSVHEADDLKLCFAKFDKNGDGQISEEELKEVMGGLGENLTDAEIKDMMHDADTNHDGFIDFEEFKALMPSKQN